MQGTIAFCAILGCSASALTNIMSQPRILHAYSKDGLFFKVFQELDPKTQVPVKGAWICVVPIAMTAFFMNLKQLSKLGCLVSLVTYSFMNTGLLQLRLKEAESSGDSSAKKFAIHCSPWTFTILAFVFSMIVNLDGYIIFKRAIVILLSLNFVHL